MSAAIYIFIIWFSSKLHIIRLWVRFSLLNLSISHLVAKKCRVTHSHIGYWLYTYRSKRSGKATTTVNYSTCFWQLWLYMCVECCCVYMLYQLSTKPQSWLPEEKIFFGVNTDRARYGANIRYCTHPRNNEMGTITVSDKLGPSSKVSNVRYFQSVPSNEVTTFYAVLPTLPN